MSTRFAALTVLFLLAGAAPGEAQRQRFKIGGGAGFATLYNPDADHGRTSVVGGGLGFRFSDNFSLETGLTFARSNRQFNETGVPVDEVQALPAFRFEANRYHLDATLFYHIGRRQPFHPFVFAGAGVERRDEKRSDIAFTFDENGIVTSRTEDVVFQSSVYEPAAHFGGGFDLYVLYNVAARAEFRLWLPQSPDKRTRMFFFGASYYF
jgi:hypothetical protein